MAQTTVWISPELLERVRQKSADSTNKAVHPGFVVSLALDAWVKGTWKPGPDLDGLKGERLFLNLDDLAYARALHKRRLEGDIHISAIYRRALQDWVDGKWEIGLVRNAS